MLSHEVFKEMDMVWGPHTLDCFASQCTKQLDRFCSQWWNPGCVAVDAFTLNWAKENVWLCPPFYLIGDVIQKIRQDGCHGTLIIPEWTSAWWWPLLFKDDNKCRAPVASWCYLQEKKMYLFLEHAGGTGLAQTAHAVKYWQCACAPGKDASIAGTAKKKKKHLKKKLGHISFSKKNPYKKKLCGRLTVLFFVLAGQRTSVNGALGASTAAGWPEAGGKLRCRCCTDEWSRSTLVARGARK